MLLKSLGDEYIGEAGVLGREYLRRRRPHATNLAVVEWDGALWRDNLALRDYLRSHPEAAAGYAQAKQRDRSSSPVTGDVATEFQPDLFDSDWGYGPYFHQTFLERRATWFRLPEVPFPKGAWINATQLGVEPELLLLEGQQIISGPLGDLFVLGIERGVLRARPEQEADMWCASGNPPPLLPWRELRIPLGGLYTPTGHLMVHAKYTRGC